MEEDDAKGDPSIPTPSCRIDQLDSDMALAMSLQHRERESTMLSTTDNQHEEEEEEEGEGEEGEEEEEEEFSDYASEDDEYDDGNGDPDYEYYSSQGVEPESGFPEEEGSNTDMDMEEDDIDPDEMSYEELMELGEIIGEERRGLTSDQISKCLTPVNCQSAAKTSIDRCVICQVEYEEGENMVTLLPCEHPYHSDCISQWLQLKRTCPICTTEVSPPKVSRIMQ